MHAALFSLQAQSCKNIVFSDSLFKCNSCDFCYEDNLSLSERLTFTSDRDVKLKVKVTGDCLVFFISYFARGVETVLVSNGKIEKEPGGKEYTPLKLVLAKQAKCSSIHQDEQHWTTRGIKTDYVKFENLEGLLKIK